MIDLLIFGRDKNDVIQFLSARGKLNAARSVNKRGDPFFSSRRVNCVETPLWIEGAKNRGSATISSISNGSATISLSKPWMREDAVLLKDGLPHATIAGRDKNESTWSVRDGFDLAEGDTVTLWSPPRKLGGYAIILRFDDDADDANPKLEDEVVKLPTMDQRRAARSKTEFKSGMIQFARDHGSMVQFGGFQFLRVGHVRIAPLAKVLAHQRANGIPTHSFSGSEVE